MTGHPIPIELREAVIALACQAAARILEVYQSAFDVIHKDDGSPLTQADVLAHAVIVSGLRRLTPDIPVLSEESPGDIARQLQRHRGRLWLVDPLDGTREFVKRNGEFTVNIALIEGGLATFGVIHQPTTGTLWHGAYGCGAFRREHAPVADGQDQAHRRDSTIACRRPATAPLRVAASRSHAGTRTAAFVARMGEVTTVAEGSSLKFCRIAEGGMDVYPRFGPTNEWDTAAGQAIVEAAGGIVVDPSGQPLRYHQRDSVRNGEFLALGDPSLPWREWMEQGAGVRE